ncbi:unnamed protein product [Ostreobium quekettii]|uniref:Enoyl reductase (ER) domain-containing protein n=1 Tax=Ostreobium quekettii TaxID=121088 RepID=A0A8S1IWD3_9CHLO|nr:unnamed protein product [Ostreobium quekettii]
MAVPPTLPATRTALVIDRETPPGQFRVAKLPMPECGDDELLVEVHACGINALDWFISGAIQRVPAFMRQDPGYVPGKDISGVVIAVGSRAAGYRPGDAIFGLTGLTLGPGMVTQLGGDGSSRGGFASHTTIKAAVAAPKPASLTHVQAAGIPLAGLTAWKAVVETAKLREGGKVLILGGAGGVGTLATQLAKRYCKAGTVAVTCSAASKELASSCGADLAIDYKSENFEEVLKGGDFDSVIDAVGTNDKFQRAAAVLKPDSGMLVDLVGPPSIGYLGTNKDSLLKFALQGFKYGASVRHQIVGVEANGPALRTMGRLLEEGTLKPVVDRVFQGLSEVQAALDYNKSGAAHGKLVVSLKE